MALFSIENIAKRSSTSSIKIPRLLNNKNEGDETKNSISLHLVSFLFKINVLYFKEKIFIKANRNNLGDFFPNP